MHAWVWDGKQVPSNATLAPWKPFVSVWQFHTPQCLFQRGLESSRGGESLWWGIQHNSDEPNAFFFYSSICALQKYNTLLHYQAHLLFISTAFSLVFFFFLLPYLIWKVSFISFHLLFRAICILDPLDDSFLFEAHILSE